VSAQPPLQLLRADLPLVLAVVALGAFGGALAFVYAQLAEAGRPPPIHLVYYVALGAGAGFVGVFLVARTDRSMPLHMMALALASGFGFKPIFDSLDALLEREQTERAAVVVQRQGAELRRVGAELREVAEEVDAESGDPEESGAGASSRAAEIAALTARIDAVLAVDPTVLLEAPEPTR